VDSIAEIIQTFSVEDVKSFRVFVQRHKKKKQRKDVDLFDLLLKSPHIKPQEILSKLYPLGNFEAYHALRKKLIKQLTDFIVLKRIDDDTTSVSQVMGLISLARYLFENQCEQLAWKYLEKGKVLAQNNHQYEQLHSIYSLQIEYAETSKFSLEKILPAYYANKELVAQNEKANIAYGIIKQRLREVRLSGEAVNFNEIIENVIAKYEVSDAFYNRPRLFFQLMNIFRSAVLASKNYSEFEPFLISNFNQFNSQTGFDKSQTEYKVSLEYMIAHTLYRNKKFDQSLLYIQQMLHTASVMNKAFVLKHYARYIMLYSANKFLTHNIDFAIEKLEDCLVDVEVKLEPESKSQILLNLSSYYLFANNAKQANNCFSQLFHSNAWCLRVMGAEWLLKKDMLEVLVQYDLGNVELALQRIKYIYKTHALLIADNRYSRVATYLKLLSFLIEKPEQIHSDGFKNTIEDSFEWVPMQQEDLQAVMYYAWFKAKVFKSNAYAVLLGLVGEV